jgi:cob(I)alamin adenosyltransferase
MRVKKLKQKLEDARHELYELHFVSATPEAYKIRREQLEWEIVCLENEIEHQEHMRPFIIVSVIAVIAMVAIFIIYYCKI